MFTRWAVLAVGCSALACGGVVDLSDTGGHGDGGGSNESGTGDSGGDSGPSAVDTSGQVDILFMIDNSSSMGDKQDYFNAAIPDFIGRLVQPNCVDPNNPLDIVGRSDSTGSCPSGSKLEFSPVHDMHVGVVTSSLGPRGGDVCSPDAMDGALNAHNDDKGELINRSGPSEAPVPDMTSSNFLAWFPATASNQGKSPNATPIVTMSAELETDFSDLVSGVHQGGCGIESQLEAWYRFLIQPDPYASIAVNDGAASWVNVDATILQQRHDFLRPASAVVIVDLSDENDSEIDVRSLGQQGYDWMLSSFQPPRATTACSTNPADPSCTSCAINSSDPNCADGNYDAANDWGFNLNLRHVHMKAKYGLDLQFPMKRYVNGLTSNVVPDRDGEYPSNSAGAMSTTYVGTNDCTNPLFASQLPDGASLDKASLCSLPQGTRSAGLVFYAHIGGVPWQLLHFVPNDANASALSAADWVAILGTNPDGYDYSGIDPHMIESYLPRAGLPDPTSADDADPDNGREWITDTNPSNSGNFVDLQFACTFPLTAPRDCTDAANSASCDCPSEAGSTWGHSYTPPVCGGAGSLNPGAPQTLQIAAKAYPTIREIELAKMMGANGVLGSICPAHVTDNADGDDPFYGYRPAITTLVNRLSTVLTN
jgi:hypothetical protein